MAVTEEILPEDDEDTRATKTLLRESKMEANALKEMFDASMKEYFDLRAQEIEMEEQTANELAIPAEFLAEYEAIEAKYAQRLAVQDTYLKLRLAQAEAVFAAECKAADDTFINGARDVRLELEDELTRSKYALIREKQRLDSLPEEPTTFDVVVGSKKRRAEEMQAPRVIRPRYAEKEDLELLSSTCQKV
ncbi:hypothetical protein HK101_010505 [Irineochytrium annulatum]|nr:hypothetical protein HK101_010505 [Irineochytrium annulatum]